MYDEFFSPLNFFGLVDDIFFKNSKLLPHKSSVGGVFMAVTT